jgi:cytochrome b561
MAAMLLSMFFIGARMVSSVEGYSTLVAIHRPLGIAILVLATVRWLNRRIQPLPDFLPTMSGVERRMIPWMERALYTLMFAMPLVGWGMLSAARYPIVLFGALHLPPILPHSVLLYTVLRTVHGVLAYLFFATFLIHLGGVLFHTLVLRDGLIQRMVPWRARPSDSGSD